MGQHNLRHACCLCCHFYSSAVFIVFHFNICNLRIVDCHVKILILKRGLKEQAAALIWLLAVLINQQGYYRMLILILPFQFPVALFWTWILAYENKKTGQKTEPVLYAGNGFYFPNFR